MYASQTSKNMEESGPETNAQKKSGVFVDGRSNGAVNVPEARHAEINQVIKEHAERENVRNKSLVHRPPV